MNIIYKLLEGVIPYNSLYNIHIFFNDIVSNY